MLKENLIITAVSPDTDDADFFLKNNINCLIRSLEINLNRFQITANYFCVLSLIISNQIQHFNIAQMINSIYV